MKELLFCLAGLALAVVGALLLIRPEWAWKLEHFWCTEGGRPSEWYETMTRLLGVFCLLTGTVIFLVMLVALILYLVF